MDWGDCVKGGSGGLDVGAPTIGCLAPLFQNVVTAVMALVGIGLFIMLIVSGFTFLTSAGDPKKLEMAKATLSNAILGLVLVVVAVFILRLIGAFTGIGDILTTFKIIIP